MAKQGRRRIDRVSAPDFLDGVEQRSPQELRSMRADCQEEEARLSYTRRLLQGRIDITRAEHGRRRGTMSGGLVDALPSILADESTGRRDQLHARRSPVYAPTEERGRRADDALADESGLGRLPDLDDDELDALLERLVAEERTVSTLRRQVLDHIDRLQDELVARLRSGALDMDQLWGQDEPA